MAAVVTFGPEKWESEARLMDWLSGLPEELEEQIRIELDAVMQRVLEASISLCPKSTGALASSISLESGVISAGDFYGCNISAGDPSIVNPVSGKPTSEYAMLVHDGHVMRDGSIYEGVPFLEEALMMYEEEIEACVDRALSELGYNQEET
jgi:hypothetical protein